MSTIKVDTITDEAGSGAPDFPNGLTTTADVFFGDNDKLKFGNGADLQIFHTGVNSYIRDLGTGNLIIDTSGATIDIKGSSPTEYMARFIKDGAVSLYYDNSAKLATTSTGVDVTGTITATAFAGDGSALTGVGGSTTYDTVGTYVFGRRAGSTSSQAVFTAGSTYAGSTLYPAGISGNVATAALTWSTSISTLYSGNTGSSALSGTWRAMGSTHPNTENPVTLFVRIS